MTDLQTQTSNQRKITNADRFVVRAVLLIIGRRPNYRARVTAKPVEIARDRMRGAAKTYRHEFMQTTV